MASPTTPTHGKLGAIYRMRPNGFKGNGLNDLAWGSGFDGAASSYFEVVIDGVGTGGGGADTFKWRQDGGAWTETVDITGAAQTLADSQTITFTATTGHTAADQWMIGNLKAEACTESGTEAQITESTRRIINPNDPPTFTDTGGETVLTIDYSRGTAVFTGNVTVVTAAGNNGYIPAAMLEKVGYLLDWNFTAEVDLADITAMGDSWEDQIAGIAKFSGGANGYFIGVDSFFDDLKDGISGDRYYFLQLFNYDPDKDQTGDHFNCWATFGGWNLDAPVRDVVKEGITFKGSGAPSFTADA